MAGRSQPHTPSPLLLFSCAAPSFVDDGEGEGDFASLLSPRAGLLPELGRHSDRRRQEAHLCRDSAQGEALEALVCGRAPATTTAGQTAVDALAAFCRQWRAQLGAHPFLSGLSATLQMQQEVETHVIRWKFRKEVLLNLPDVHGGEFVADAVGLLRNTLRWKLSAPGDYLEVTLDSRTSGAELSQQKHAMPRHDQLDATPTGTRRVTALLRAPDTLADTQANLLASVFADAVGLTAPKQHFSSAKTPSRGFKASGVRSGGVQKKVSGRRNASPSSLSLI